MARLCEFVLSCADCRAQGVCVCVCVCPEECECVLTTEYKILLCCAYPPCASPAVDHSSTFDLLSAQSAPITISEIVCLFGVFTSSPTTRLYHGRVPRFTSDNFTCCYTRQSGDTMTSVSAGHILV